MGLEPPWSVSLPFLRRPARRTADNMWGWGISQLSGDDRDRTVVPAGRMRIRSRPRT
jgi:hypothetical protein